MVQYAAMKSNDIIADARVMHLRELKTSLTDVKARLAKVEAERDVLSAHFSLSLVALRDFERLPEGAGLRIIDGWNAILRFRNVSKLSADDISRLKKEYLAGLGITPPSDADDSVHPESLPPVATWIIFDGKVANSYRCGEYRVTYTGGIGAHRADRMILDFVNAVRILGLDVSRITVETSDKSLALHVRSAGAKTADYLIASLRHCNGDLPVS